MNELQALFSQANSYTQYSDEALTNEIKIAQAEVLELIGEADLDVEPEVLSDEELAFFNQCQEEYVSEEETVISPTTTSVITDEPIITDLHLSTAEELIFDQLAPSIDEFDDINEYTEAMAQVVRAILADR